MTSPRPGATKRLRRGGNRSSWIGFPSSADEDDRNRGHRHENLGRWRCRGTELLARRELARRPAKCRQDEMANLS